tara:strand:+ start:842 stop:952 length:111 start_codon:yes stop_codon:yes gene_type:complete
MRQLDNIDELVNRYMRMKRKRFLSKFKIKFLSKRKS